MAGLSEQEGKQLIEAFNKLKIKPKFDTTEDLQTWLKEYGAQQTVKVEPTTTSAAATTTVTTTQQPRISLFYGDNIKGEATYAQWVYEVKCLLLEKTHKPEALAQAIRRSLRGEASNLARRLGIGATIPQILEKFESVYGEVDTKEHLLAKFYSAKQEENEDVATWSCRLEDILSTAVDRRLVDSSNVNEMLRNMFWQGLKPVLKDISGYKFEKITDFDKLRVEIRKLEQDHLQPTTKNTQCHVTQTNSENTELKEMKTMIQSLSSTVKDLEKKININSQQDQPTYQTNRIGNNFNQQQGKRNDRKYNNYNNRPYITNSQRPNRFNHQGFQNRSRQQQHPNQTQSNVRPSFNSNNQDYSNSYQGYSQYQGQGQGQNQTQGHISNQAQEEEDFNTGPLCFRCRQYGHYQWNCPVSRMDHSRKYLN